MQKRIQNYINQRKDCWDEYKISRSTGLSVDEVGSIVRSLGYSLPGPGHSVKFKKNKPKKEEDEISKKQPKNKSGKGYTIEDLKNKFDVVYKIKKVINNMPKGILYPESVLLEETGCRRNPKWFAAIKSEEVRWYAIQFENKDIAYGPRSEVLKFKKELPDSRLLRKE